MIKCKSTSCGVAQKDVIGMCEWLPFARPCLIGPKTHSHCTLNSPIFFIALLVLLAWFGGCVFCRKKKEQGSVNSQPDSQAESPRDEPDEEATAPESLETRAAAKTKAAETVERPGFTRKLSSFLFGEQEEAPKEEEATAPLAEQPPTRHAEPDPIAPKAKEMHQRMAGWYNDAPEAAALRAAWGEYPGTPDALQAWPGFVQVTNAFLDAKLDEA